MRAFRFLVTVYVFLISGTAFAQSITPNQVFMQVDVINQELSALNEQNFSTAKGAKKPDAAVSPRHVYNLGLDQWRKVQLLRFINGLEAHSLPDLDVTAITPGEVKRLVDELLGHVQDLRPAYGLAASSIDVGQVSGKNPADVYAHLLTVSNQLDALGVPMTVPNDVYRVAATVNVALDRLAQQTDLKVDLAPVVMKTGRSPADAYNAGRSLLEELEKLTAQHPKYGIPNGIAVPPLKTEGVTPNDVILILSRILADTIAIMDQVDAAKTVKLAPYVGGKTPSDVYHSIMKSIAIVQAMQS